MLGICVVFLFACAFLKAISEIQFRMQILLWDTLRDLAIPPAAPPPLASAASCPQTNLLPVLPPAPPLLGIYERNESEAAQWENFEELMAQFTHHLLTPPPHSSIHYI